MKGSLEGKTALVTGAARGLGRAIALRLAGEGAQVAVHYGRSASQAEEIIAEISRVGGQAFGVRADFSDPSAPGALAAAVNERFGEAGLDILVNNAGLQTRDGLTDIAESDYDTLFQINVKAPFFLTSRLLPTLRDGGRIVNVSSGLSQGAFPEKGVYAMTKAAINSFTRSLAKQLGPRGITVNAVAPGIVGTDMNAWVRSEEGARRVAAMTALGRVAEPEDIADVVAFLCGPDARWITGAYIDASGGQHLR